MAYIHKLRPSAIYMDKRRFDRNADQLCQIMNHYRLLQDKKCNGESVLIENMLTMLEYCLQVNDEVALWPKME